MTKFIFMQKTRDYYEVEADSEVEAIGLILSGDATVRKTVRNTRYEDLDLIEGISHSRDPEFWKDGGEV